MYEWSMFKKQNLCGYVLIDLVGFLDGETHEMEVKVNPQGSMKIELQYTDDACLFGMDLEGAAARGGQKVPIVINQCVSYLNEHALQTVPQRGSNPFFLIVCAPC